jgi:hypothetical protein
MFHWTIWLAIVILFGSFIAAVVYNLLSMKEKENESK